MRFLAVDAALADTADVLRGLASRQLPDHLLPLPDCTGLAARAAGFRRGRGRCVALPPRHRHRPRAVTEPRDDARRAGFAPGHDDLRPRLATGAMGRADEYGELARSRSRTCRHRHRQRRGSRSRCGSAARCSTSACDAGAQAGRRGALLYHDGREVDVPGHPVEVVNGLGAGDAFVGGLVQACTRACRSTRRYAAVRSPVRSSRRSWHARKRCRRLKSSRRSSVTRSCCATASGTWSTPRRRSWRYLSVPASSASRRRAVSRQTGEEEIALVPLGGRCAIEAAVSVGSSANARVSSTACRGRCTSRATRSTCCPPSARSNSPSAERSRTNGFEPRARHARRRRDRGARLRQRDAPDQPHHQARVPRSSACWSSRCSRPRETGRATRRTSTTRITHPDEVVLEEVYYYRTQASRRVRSRCSACTARSTGPT